MSKPVEAFLFPRAEVMSKPRRLIVTDTNGSPLQVSNHYQIDLTDIHNADSRTPLHATVQEQCNLGCWHNYESVRLPHWSDPR
jgi:hypothetical protein